MGKLRPPAGTGKGPLGTPAPQIKFRSIAEMKKSAAETVKHVQQRINKITGKGGK